MGCSGGKNTIFPEHPVCTSTWQLGHILFDGWATPGGFGSKTFFYYSKQLFFDDRHPSPPPLLFSPQPPPLTLLPATPSPYSSPLNSLSSPTPISLARPPPHQLNLLKGLVHILTSQLNQVEERKREWEREREREGAVISPVSIIGIISSQGQCLKPETDERPPSSFNQPFKMSPGYFNCSKVTLLQLGQGRRERRKEKM